MSGVAIVHQVPASHRVITLGMSRVGIRCGTHLVSIGEWLWSHARLDMVSMCGPRSELDLDPKGKHFFLELSFMKALLCSSEHPAQQSANALLSTPLADRNIPSASHCRTVCPGQLLLRDGSTIARWAKAFGSDQLGAVTGQNEKSGRGFNE